MRPPESNASTSEANAKKSETNVKASENAAASSNSNAGKSASAAKTSENNAAASASSAAASAKTDADNLWTKSALTKAVLVGLGWLQMTPHPSLAVLPLPALLRIEGEVQPQPLTHTVWLAVTTAYSSALMVLTGT
jgi:hypothetical protein